MDTADYFARASYDCLRNIAKGLSKADEKNEVRRLLAIARINRENQRISRDAIAKAHVRLSRELMAEVKAELESLGKEWSARYEERAILQPIANIERQARDRLNAVGTVMGISVRQLADRSFAQINDDRYRILSTAAAETATGVLTYREAIAAGIERLAMADVTGYVDKKGRRWSSEAYVSMDIRTTLRNAKNAAAEEIGKQAGCNVFYVTTHSNARPLCAPYQGRYFSTDGTYGTIYDINGNPHEYEPVENTSYGDPAGLFGINCQHDRVPVLDGAFRDRSKEEIPPDPKGYEDEQKARGMEREIRALKRAAGIMRAGGEASGKKYRKTLSRIDEKTEIYYDFCKRNQIREMDSRLEIYD